MILQDTQSLQLAASSSDSSPASPGVNLVASVQAASFNSAGFFVGYSRSLVVTASCTATGSPSGSLKLQGCNDPSTGMSDKVPTANLVNWYDLMTYDPTTGALHSSVSSTVTNATTAIFELKDCTPRWVRLVWTRVSGSITITVYAQFKGTT